MMSQSHRSGYQVNSDLAALYNVHYLMHQSPQLRAVARHETHHGVCVTRVTRQSDVYCKDVQTDLYSNTLQYATDKTPGHIEGCSTSPHTLECMHVRQMSY